MSATGAALVAASTIVADVVLGEDADAGRGRTVEQAEPARPEAHLRRGLLARRIEDADVRVRAAHESGRGLEQEGGLADPGLAAQEDERSGHEPAAEDTVQFADADGQPRDIRVADLGEWRGRRTARRASRADPLRAARDGSRMTVSTRLFQAPHARH